jgi:hypothetical protein
VAAGPLYTSWNIPVAIKIVELVCRTRANRGSNTRGVNPVPGLERPGPGVVEFRLPECTRRAAR